MGARRNFRRGGGGKPKNRPHHIVKTSKKAPNMVKKAPHNETKCARGVGVFFFVTKMRSSNSAHIYKSDFTTEEIV